VGALGLWFCQGFSEPGAGSDLASLRTSAVRDGDHYIVNGCKTWVAYAHRADWMYALVRTDKAAPKHRGISYLLIDMKSPGVTVRPIDTLDGVPQVSEVRLDNVRVPVENRIGEENKGWQYARHTLGYERLQVAKVGLSKGRVALAKKLAETVVENGRPLSENRRFREKLALLEVELKALELTNMRLVVQNMREDGQHKQDPKVLVLKIKGTEMQQMVNEVLLDLAGPHSIPKQTEFFSASSDEVIGPEWAASTGPNYFQTRARSITAGSNEIQRNIMAKKLLGL
jgi:alkylation response protein AidB-like acyl-CoA dehydrogenase